MSANKLKVYGCLPIIKSRPCFANIIYTNKGKYFMLDGNGNYYLKEVLIDKSWNNLISEPNFNTIVSFSKDDIIEKKIYSYYIYGGSMLFGYRNEIVEFIKSNFNEIIEHGASITTIVEFCGECISDSILTNIDQLKKNKKKIEKLTTELDTVIQKPKKIIYDNPAVEKMSVYANNHRKATLRPRRRKNRNIGVTVIQSHSRKVPTLTPKRTILKTLATEIPKKKARTSDKKNNK